MKTVAPLFLICLGISFVLCSSGSDVTFVTGTDQIDVMIGGKLFTSYMYRESLTKPILYPIVTPSGTEINRGFPFNPREGESTDHPHHTGIFFTYDEVNKDGFWNNTTSPPQIKHMKVTEMTGGKGKGTLSIVMNWVAKSGKTLLQEDRTMVFMSGKTAYNIDFTMKLTAKDTAVTFHDTKEGMFGIRLADWMKEKGGTGKYLSSNGDETEKNVWGKRAEWVTLEAEKDGRPVGVAVLNHPTSNNYPTFWHARAYGLFAANPLGQYVFESSKKVENPTAYNLSLKQGESALFRFRVILYEGKKTKEELDREFKAYSQ